MYFFEGVYVRRKNLNWGFKPIGEIFRFFPKYNDIYLPGRKTSEIFRAFERKKWSPPPPPHHPPPPPPPGRD